MWREKNCLETGWQCWVWDLWIELKSWGAAGCIPAVQYPGWEYEDGESTALLVSQPASAHSPVTLGEIFTLTAV